MYFSCFPCAGGSQSRLLLRRSSLENCHATVILSCLADGELLPPAVIFKVFCCCFSFAAHKFYIIVLLFFMVCFFFNLQGEGPTETITFNDVSLIVFYQKDCCVTTAIMQQWLELVWTR